MKIHVTREHIIHGLHGKPSQCPIALAIIQQTGRKLVVVGEKWVWWGFIAFRRWWMPPNVRDWVRDFDSRRPVQPTLFYIPISRTLRRTISDYMERFRAQRVQGSEVLMRTKPKNNILNEEKKRARPARVVLGVSLAAPRTKQPTKYLS